ncbi:MAG TPA: L-histidine N(alpha)-methyltransferase [Nocardioidaceae bacterium]|nr:L-histidine N(alpha)-methyltransferase [Nocardioidaceae bacterium]
MKTHTIDVHLGDDDLRASLEKDVRDGLTGTVKTLPPKYFYDARGSELFEEITELPEYYPTRRERSILEARADEIAAASGAETLVELGSGSSVKTRLLLDGLQRAGTLRRYVPVDVSPTALEGAMDALAPDYPHLQLHGVVADFEHHLGLLPTGGRRMVAFLGGTIGNLTPAERLAFLTDVRSGLEEGDTLLLGTDLVKEPTRLVAAYDDAAGVTAAFNKNVLAVLNRTLAADFDLASFDHVAVWNAEEEWIEMRLRSLRPQSVQVRELGLRLHFAQGEEIRTEISAKFRQARLEAELAQAGYRLAHWWTDPDEDFALSLAVPA